MKEAFCILAASALIFTGCKDDSEPEPTPQTSINTIPAFYLPSTDAESYGKNTPDLVLIADAGQRVSEPWDLDFHPSRANELWVLNKGTNNTGGSTVTISNAGLGNQSEEWRRDGNAWHFMALPSALSFSQENDNWATSAEILDANRQGGSFTGPSLWSSDMDIYARPSGGNGSHLDMLHASPYSMGIESDKDNAFWVYDGQNGHLVWYDFNEDHGPGASNHDDGVVHRYTEVEVKRKADVASHLVLDKETGWLYFADPGNTRIIKVNTNTGSKSRDLSLINEQLAEHAEYTGVEWKVFASTGLESPAGVELIGDVLYVSDNATGEIIAYGVETGFELGRFDTGKIGIMGIKADKEGKLWFVCEATNEVFKIEPK